MAAEAVKVRACPGCGTKLSRYNPDSVCGTCDQAGHRPVGSTVLEQLQDRSAQHVRAIGLARRLSLPVELAGSPVVENLQDRSEQRFRRVAGLAGRLAPPSGMAASPVPVISRDRSSAIEIGRALREYRHVRGLTQAQQAQLLGVDPAALRPREMSGAYATPHSARIPSHLRFGRSPARPTEAVGMGVARAGRPYGAVPP